MRKRPPPRSRRPTDVAKAGLRSKVRPALAAALSCRAPDWRLRRRLRQDQVTPVRPRRQGSPTVSLCAGLVSGLRLENRRSVARDCDSGPRPRAAVVVAGGPLGAPTFSCTERQRSNVHGRRASRSLYQLGRSTPAIPSPHEGINTTSGGVCRRKTR